MRSPTVAEILHVLGDEQTLDLFQRASTGLSSSPDSIEQLGLSRKQFYSRLESLLRTGLIEKRDGVYRQTTFGSMVADSPLKPLLRTVANYWNIVAADELKKSKTIPEEQLAQIVSAMRGELAPAPPLEAAPVAPATPEASPVTTVKEYKDLVALLAAGIRGAKTEIYLASRFYDPEVGKALIERFAANVKIKILDGNPASSTMANRMQAVLKASQDPRMEALVLAMMKSPNFQMRTAELEYCFAVVDGVRCGVEVTDPSRPQDFNLALAFDDRTFGARLVGQFEQLWKNAEQKMVAPPGRIPE